MKIYRGTIIASIVFILFQILSSGTVMANSSNTGTFESALKTHVDAIANRNWPAFESTLTSAKNLTFVQPNGKLSTTTADFKRQMQTWFADKDWSWNLEPLSKEIITNTGIAIFRVTYNDVDQLGKPVVLKYLLTLVFVKEASGWKLMHDQNTMLAK